MDSTKSSVSKKGNPAWIKGGPSPTPSGRPKGSLSKWSESRLRHLLDVMGESADKLIKKAVQKALDDEDKDQGMCLKLLIDKLVPTTKAVELTGVGGKELAVRVLVESVETFNTVRIIEGETLEHSE